MAREMTPQERAAALYATLSCVLYNEGHHDADQDIAVLAEALQTTRRAALLECANRIFAEHKSIDSDKWIDLGNELRKLAQEG